jgi:hypothetical protein
MPEEIIIWQFKSNTLERPDLDQFLGATLGDWAPGTTLRVRCKRATRGAIAKAAQLNADGRIFIIIEERD